ncbi:hypothetical protein HUG17_3261 [Dermatophagoides farinae]|nr:hypothetical protein HUG17_3261 [Dermatophagoides farinae]
MMAIILTLIRLTTWIGDNSNHHHRRHHNFINNPKLLTIKDHHRQYIQQYQNFYKNNQNNDEKSSNLRNNITIDNNHNNDNAKNKTQQNQKQQQQQQKQQSEPKWEIALQRQIVQQSNIIDCATLFLYLMSLYSVYNENYTLSSTTTISMIFMIVIKLYLILFDPIIIWWNIFQLIIPIIIIIVSLIYLIQLDYLIKYYETLFPTTTTPIPTTMTTSSSSTDTIYSDQERRLHQLAITNRNNNRELITSTSRPNDLPPTYQEALDCPFPKYYSDEIKVSMNNENDNDDNDRNSHLITNEKINEA